LDCGLFCAAASRLQSDCEEPKERSVANSILIMYERTMFASSTIPQLETGNFSEKTEFSEGAGCCEETIFSSANQQRATSAMRTSRSSGNTSDTPRQVGHRRIYGSLLRAGLSGRGLLPRRARSDSRHLKRPADQATAPRRERVDLLRIAPRRQYSASLVLPLLNAPHHIRKR
jgi:hypothetical protein